MEWFKKERKSESRSLITMIEDPLGGIGAHWTAAFFPLLSFLRTPFSSPPQRRSSSLFIPFSEWFSTAIRDRVHRGEQHGEVERSVSKGGGKKRSAHRCALCRLSTQKNNNPSLNMFNIASAVHEWGTANPSSRGVGRSAGKLTDLRRRLHNPRIERV